MDDFKWAIEKGYVKMVEDFLKRGANVNAVNEDHRNTPIFHMWEPIHFACYYGYDEIVRLLLHYGAYIEGKNSDAGQTPLQCACENGHEAVVRHLVTNGANVNATSNNGWSVLYWATRNGLFAWRKQYAIVELLLKGGADVSMTGKYGFPPLYNVRQYGNTAIAKLLQKYGAK